MQYRDKRYQNRPS
uniref:Uncharacterized protein n=1 Tax=Anguilla anguilla TaxID=7936 RepID=A0A0E9R7A7_ANGAN